jgi:hypothetical protein
MVSNPSIDTLRSLFVSVLPRIENHARVYFRHTRCWHRKEDRVRETIAVCWKWFLRLFERGKDPTQFISAMASLAARHVHGGRRLCTQDKAGDAMSPAAQQKHGFLICKLPDQSTLTENPLSDALQDNTQTEVPEQVSFRIDFPAWLDTHSDRNRSLIKEMMLSRGTNELARRFRLTPGRVSQMRQQFEEDWALFTV